MLAKFFRFLFIAALALYCSACATPSFAPTDLDAAAKRFEVTPGKSNIYIYRNEDVIANTEIAVEVNGMAAGKTGKATFILTSVDPGRQLIVAYAENTEALELDTQAGKNYFVWMEIRLGVVTNHAHFHVVDEARGKAGVRECRLLEA